MARQRKAVVIGGGVIGVTGAWALARRGWKVEVLDAAARPASGASLGNARQLSFTYTDALASPYLLPALPKIALGLDPAMQMALPRDPEWFDWVIRFLRNCTKKRYCANTLASLALAERSRDELDQLLSDHALEFEQEMAGKLVIYRDPASFARAQDIMAIKLDHGAVQSPLAAQEIAQIEPALAGIEGLAGAIYAPHDRSGNCALFTRALMELAMREYGATWRGGQDVLSLEPRAKGALVHCANGHSLAADLVVISGGHRSNRLLAPLGHYQPIKALKGYSFTAPATSRTPGKSVTDSTNRLVFTNIGQRVLVAGIADLADDRPEFSAKRFDSLLRAAKTALPDAADWDGTADHWCGHRPLTPNSLPITTMLEPWLAANTGHGALGWTLAMGSAAKLADCVEAAA